MTNNRYQNEISFDDTFSQRDNITGRSGDIKFDNLSSGSYKPFKPVKDEEFQSLINKPFPTIKSVRKHKGYDLVFSQQNNFTRSVAIKFDDNLSPGSNEPIKSVTDENFQELIETSTEIKDDDNLNSKSKKQIIPVTNEEYQLLMRTPIKSIRKQRGYNNIHSQHDNTAGRISFEIKGDYNLSLGQISN
ncbi:5067_t:CDS:1 [Funneliformis caledonium]|uniref:5067_t:CDS:1 n=1 Tax=Funneliformis caledonium TaxID=1117310 RepID=A0A9N9DA93_9GLOM|nr:5067_t:CDS:1 [Funneliformis caledonium]